MKTCSKNLGFLDECADNETKIERKIEVEAIISKNDIFGSAAVFHLIVLDHINLNENLTSDLGGYWRSTRKTTFKNIRFSAHDRHTKDIEALCEKKRSSLKRCSNRMSNISHWLRDSECLLRIESIALPYQLRWHRNDGGNYSSETLLITQAGSCVVFV